MNQDEEIARRDREIEELRSLLASRDRELEEARQQGAVVDGSSVVDQLAARRTVRRFTDDPVREEDVRRAVECGQRASTSSWIQAFALLQISGELRERSTPHPAASQWLLRRLPLTLWVGTQAAGD